MTRWLPAMAMALGAVAAGAGPALLPLLPGGDVRGWEEHRFAGSTRYRTVALGDVHALRADADGEASGLYLKRRVELGHWPLLRWRWRVAHALVPADERARNGDDFAARVYVVSGDPLRFWKTRTLCYVWAGRAGVGASWRNPYADDVVMVVLRSGDAEAGHWVEERRDVAADFRRHFGEAPRAVDAVAIMTDTDQTGSRATAWYEGLRFERHGG